MATLAPRLLSSAAVASPMPASHMRKEISSKPSSCGEMMEFSTESRCAPEAPPVTTQSLSKKYSFLEAIAHDMGFSKGDTPRPACLGDMSWGVSRYMVVSSTAGKAAMFMVDRTHRQAGEDYLEHASVSVTDLHCISDACLQRSSGYRDRERERRLDAMRQP